MHLENIHIVNFKNWEQASASFSEKVNCFVGSNASGKTNLLDAIHYLSMCKSYFNSGDRQNIRDTSDFFVVEGSFAKGDVDFDIYCGLKRDQKKIFKRNKKPYDKLTEHIGQFPSVVISPYDRDLITEGSEVRRRFMDVVISQSDPVYLDDLVRYKKALNQRNTLLKYFMANQVFDAENLEIYDLEMSTRAMPIYEKRKHFIQELQPLLKHYYEFISDKSESPELHYKSDLEAGELKDLLSANLQKDRFSQYTGVGIHKDDLEFSIDGRSVKKFGSQGQQKSYLIALKLAQYEFLKKSNGAKPMLLLDDVFDKLDEGRVEQLIKLVNDEEFGQIFITDTHMERTGELVKKINRDARVFRVENGTITDEKG